jgi:hypothetical protein
MNNYVKFVFFFFLSGMSFFQQNIRYMSLFVQVLSTLTMKFHSKNLYTCREPVVIVRCIFLEIYIINFVYFLNDQSQYILEITMPFVRAG